MSDDYQRPNDSFFKLPSLEDQPISALGQVISCDLRTNNPGLVMNLAALRLHPMQARAEYKHLSMVKEAISWRLNKQYTLYQSVSIRQNLVTQILSKILGLEQM